MNILLLALALGLTCAAQNLDDTSWEMNEELTKRWNTIYLVANRKKMISENGPLRLYVRSMNTVFNGDLDITFYIRVNFTCQKFNVSATKTEDIWYTLSYSGQSYFYIMSHVKKMCLIFLAHVSEDGDVTSMLLALAPVPETELSPKNYDIFIRKINEMKVPVKNIIKVSETDTCPP